MPDQYPFYGPGLPGRVALSNNRARVLVGFDDSASVSAFGQSRVVSPVSIHNSQLQYDLSPLFWDDKTTGGTITHLPDQSSARLRLTGPNQSYLRQTKKYHRYQPGKSQNPTITFVPLNTPTGITVEVGYGDDDNGIFFQVIDGVPAFTLRSKASGTVVDDTKLQSNWNLDRLDGSGGDFNQSGITLNHNTSQIFTPDLEWLGVGRVRCGFNINGRTIYAHQFNHANVTAHAYMTTANLPVRYKISSDETVGAGTYDLIQICNDVSSEGGQNIELGIPFAASNGATTISITTRRPILSIRPRATFNSIVNRGLIDPEDYNVYSEDQGAYVELVYGGSISGASWASVSTDYSIVERDISGTAITGGFVIHSQFVPASSVGSNSTPGAAVANILSKLPLALDIDGNHPTTPLTDNLSLVVTSIPGTATDVSGRFGWRELR